MHYHRLSMLIVLSTARLGNLATLPPLWDDIQVKHTWNAVPTNWESIGHPPANTTIDLHIALKPHRESALIDALYAVSDPSLPTYGVHLSKEQVAELVAPHPETLGLVNSWLEHCGVSSPVSMTHGGGWLTVTGVPVSQANDLLGASYQLYRHTSTNETILRTVGYALPAVLHAHVQTVAPTTYFSPPRTLQQTPRRRPREEATEMANATLGELVTVLSDRAQEVHVMPESLRRLYNTRAYVPVAMDRNVLGIAGYMGQSPSEEDLRMFMNTYRTEAKDATFTTMDVNNGKSDLEQSSVEASMNIQYAEGMAYPTPLIYYNIGGEVTWSKRTKKPKKGDSDLEWLNYVIKQPKAPQTISISYGNEEQGLPREYVTPLCNLFAQLGLRGVSVLVSTGNDGVGEGDCKDASGKVQFVPYFPATCPYVTSVGGTTSYPEVAANLSGGGFSLYFPRPTYQDHAVSTFLRQYSGENAGFYNPAGRGIPDISAQAIQFNVVVDNRPLRVDGTSCATPTVAGIISLLNDYRLSKGKGPLGWLNPLLYDRGLAGLNDITSGSNPGCNTEGFPAIAGWDPVTGLGTPDFIKLQQVFVNGVPYQTRTSDAPHSSDTPN